MESHGKRSQEILRWSNAEFCQHIQPMRRTYICDGLRVPAVFPARLLGDGRQAQQGLDTDITLPTTWLSALQMAAPRVAI